MSRIHVFLAVAVSTLLSVPTSESWAQTLPAPVPEVVSGANNVKTLDTVVVSGSHPGPGMWHVQNGENELWVMGTFSPLPEELDWDASTAISVMSESDEVIWSPRFIVDMEAGFFRKAYLGFQYHRAQRNPEGKTLQEILDPTLYRRWENARVRYDLRERVNRMRPLVAANELLAAAFNYYQLSTRNVIWSKVSPELDGRGIRSTIPTTTVMIGNPAAALRELKSEALEDSVCLQVTLDLIESDMGRIVRSANSWSTGDVSGIDVDLLRRRDSACSDAFSNNDFTKKLGIPSVELSMREETMKALEAALSRNLSTVAFLPVSRLKGENGYLNMLRLKGYRVTEPASTGIELQLEK